MFDLKQTTVMYIVYKELKSVIYQNILKLTEKEKQWKEK